MDILVAYDVNTTSDGGPRRLRRVAIACQRYGQRVQYSIFECRVSRSQLETLENELLDLIDPTLDSLRIYTLTGKREESVRVHGLDHYQDFDDPLIL